MHRSRLALVLFVAACAHAEVQRFPPADDCNDTATCRAQQAERARLFTRAVAAEPASTRLPLERVHALVLVDRAAGLVYALDTSLVAFDLQTGAERWRIADVTGDDLWRAGRFVVVTAQASPTQAPLTLVDLDDPKKAARCRIALPAPVEADESSMHAFDRRGQPYVFWRSAWRYSGGTRPDRSAEEREDRSLGCGVLRVDVARCTTSAEPLKSFLWDPPRGRGMKHPDMCPWLSPMIDLPAAAASEPRAFDGAAPALRVNATQRPSMSCGSSPDLELQAMRDDVLVWSKPLRDGRARECPP